MREAWVRRSAPASGLRDLFAPLPGDEPERSFVGRMALVVAAFILAALAAYTVIGLLVSANPLRVVGLIVGASVICAGTLLLVRAHHEMAAAAFAAGGIWLVSAASVFTGGGLQAPSAALQCVFVAVAALLLGRRAAVAALAFSLATVVLIAGGERADLLPQSMLIHTPASRAGVLCVAILMVGAIVIVAVTGQRRAMARAEYELSERASAEAELRRRVAELDSLQQLSQVLTGRIELKQGIEEARRLVVELFDAESVEILPLPAAEALDEAVAAVQPRSPDQAHRLCVPLSARGELLGVLRIVRGELGAPFTEREQAVAATAGELVATAMMSERLHALETSEAALGERRRIARDLHDAVAQSIYSASLIAETLPEVWAESPAKGRQELLHLRRSVKSALGEMRGVLCELRPEAIALTPLPVLLGRLADALAGRDDIDVTIAVDDELALPPDVHVACYRIAQEAFNNVGKYAHASHLSAVMRRDDNGARLTVHDDGCGFDATVTAKGMGGSIMQERARAIGAQVTIESAPGRGTTVSLMWPGDAAQSPGGDLREAGVREICAEAQAIG